MRENPLARGSSWESIATAGGGANARERESSMGRAAPGTGSSRATVCARTTPSSRITVTMVFSWKWMARTTCIK
jgi:hypothetical protein